MSGNALLKRLPSEAGSWTVPIEYYTDQEFKVITLQLILKKALKVDYNYVNMNQETKLILGYKFKKIKTNTTNGPTVYFPHK